MKVQILGIMQVDMKDSQTGRPIQGLSLHLCDADETQSPGWYGRHCAKVFVSYQILGDINLRVGQIVRLNYSQTLGSKKASLSGIEVIK